MQPSALTNESEAILQWKLAIAALASGTENVRQDRLEGLHAIWTDSMFPLANQIVAERAMPAEHYAETALRYVGERPVPWMLCIPRDWVDESGSTVLARCGLVPAMQLTYMTTYRLLPPQHTVPEAEYRLVDTGEAATIVSDLNSDAYGMPREWGRSALANPRMWTEDGVGVIAYEYGEPVSTATVVPTAGCLNVLCVATRESHRGKGLAQAAMRQALDLAARKTGLSRTVLHATDMGKPVYERMGYQSSTVFTVWTQRHPDA